MYPLKRIYSRRAYNAWKLKRGRVDLDEFTSSWDEVLTDNPWEVSTWDELRGAVSFLTMMNKREVLYFRGQRAHYPRCLPVLLRDSWKLAGEEFFLTKANRRAYYEALPELQDRLIEVVRKVGTPRQYLLEQVPAAAATILQHYELWPTHFIDVTRSLPVAIAFASYARPLDAYLYTFAMPDLRGSITSDMDQHLTLARLEAVCPPTAKRPHHQDAYLVSRFPEPPLAGVTHDRRWVDWLDKSDLMRRLVARFRLVLRAGRLPGAPVVARSFLIPSRSSDPFAQQLQQRILPIALSKARDIAA